MVGGAGQPEGASRIVTIPGRLGAVVDPAVIAGSSVRPRTEDEAARVLETAAVQGWRVALAGGGSWVPEDPDADLVVHSTDLAGGIDLQAGDLVVSVPAAMCLSQLDERLAPAGVWWPVDPPGGDRTVGSVVATGTAGALRAAFGPVRDQVLGMRVVTRTGRILQLGGRVVKNVAGYDLARLFVGSRGSLGLITRLHLRLRARPPIDRTLLIDVAPGEMGEVVRIIRTAPLVPAAFEVIDAGADTVRIALRLLGQPAAVDAEIGALEQALTPGGPGPVALEDSDGYWHDRRRAVGPASFRLGIPFTGLRDAMEGLRRQLPPGVASASVGGTVSIRWSGKVPAPEAWRRFISRARERGWPVVAERLPRDLEAESARATDPVAAALEARVRGVLVTDRDRGPQAP